MKNKILLLGLILSVLLTGCQQEGCTDSEALNYNSEVTVDDCSCIYPEPIEEEPDPRDPYFGTYLVIDSLFLDGGFYEAVTYSLYVTPKESTGDTIYFENMWNDGSDYFGILTDINFSIPSQQVSGPYYTEGNGGFINGRITYETSGDVYLHKGIGDKL